MSEEGRIKKIIDERSKDNGKALKSFAAALPPEVKAGLVKIAGNYQAAINANCEQIVKAIFFLHEPSPIIDMYAYLDEVMEGKEKVSPATTEYARLLSQVAELLQDHDIAVDDALRTQLTQAVHVESLTDSCNAAFHRSWVKNGGTPYELTRTLPTIKIIGKKPLEFLLGGGVALPDH